MGKRIIITGATGLIGKRIVPILTDKGYEITIFTRNIDSVKTKFSNISLNYIKWDYTKPIDSIIEYINGCEIIINLAGASIGDRRWNEKYKKIIYGSRILTTKKIVEAISKCKDKPNTLISSSAIGFYGTTGEEIQTEKSPGSNDFMAKLCSDWENEAIKAEEYGIRVTTTRTGIVLDKNKGALERFLTPFKLFSGGYQGTGRQWISWIHIDDLINLFLFSIENDKINGALNCTTQFPVTN
ncbi:MAG: TIGR01777 family oxidoreductase, partial [Ignavibacteria bacterium]